jgi:hypothetical protein
MRRTLIALVATASFVGCQSSSPGVVRQSEGNPIVAVGAGGIESGGGATYFARYVIDTRAKVCWFFAGNSVAALDCCALLNVAEARQHVAWKNEATCATGAPSPHRAE